MDLRESEQEVLVDLLVNGDNIQANLSDNTGRRMKTVRSALDDLERKGLIRDKSRGVYTLTDEGKEMSEPLSKIHSS